jgi:cysteine synthase
MVAAAYGCRAHIVMPDDAAVEKVQMLQALGAEVQRVRPVSIAHPDHFVNIARRLAAREVCASHFNTFYKILRAEGAGRNVTWKVCS